MKATVTEGRAPHLGARAIIELSQRIAPFFQATALPSGGKAAMERIHQVQLAETEVTSSSTRTTI